MSQITLHQFPPAFGLPNASPFCVKLELILRIFELDYQNHYTMQLKKAPKGKFPYLTDGDKTIADSEFVMDYLIKTYRPDFDQSLTDEQHGIGTALSRMLNEHTYWVMVYSRWVEPEGWNRMKSLFFRKIPLPLRPIITTLVQRKIKNSLWAQGIGRHQRDEIYGRAMQDLEAVEALLPESYFLFGDEPCRYDCSIYAFIVNILATPFENPLKDKARSLPKLIRYTKQLSVKYFPDFNISLDV
ncbi:MAG: glutathione S-transferase [Kangiellaceae bacterium]|nr:glutathione S-transferase [Kangiellaceae bacterium]|tara:strand:+ start:5003 stop:5731 length:729 start_codon:yes stop_codon:yes gene_type:complete